jgi:hypothetical protein
LSEKLPRITASDVIKALEKEGLLRSILSDAGLTVEQLKGLIGKQ